MSESRSTDRRSTRSSKRKTSPVPPRPSRESSESTSPPPPKKARTAAKPTDEGGLPLPHSITPDVFRQHLERYPSCVPDKLHKLDQARYETIPVAVRSRQRRTSKGDPAVDTSGGAGADAGAASDHEEDEEEDEGYGFLTKEEVVQLVEWKLKHGTFRPALLGMARAHPPDAIRKTTSLAFQQLLSPPSTSSSKSATSPTGAPAAMKTLCTLRGIGPATASLLLSCANTSSVPFFSDELYRWMMWDSADTPGKGSGWTRKIGYTDKEYTALRQAVGRTLERMKGEEWDEVGAMDLEKVAYVLGKGDS